MRKIIVGTRRSDLALWQTHHVIDSLKNAYDDLTAEVVVISTKGDEILDKPLPEIGGKGLFTEALEAALRAKEIDIAVHSLKDLPTQNPPGITVGAVPARADVRDVLVSRDGHTLDTLPQGATVGTSSRRRQAQLLAYRPDLRLIDIRGNVPTRIEKTLNPDGPYDATVLAKAGVDRLQLAEHISQVLPLNIMLPAPGQGALGIQCRDDETARHLLQPLTDQAALAAVTAERAFLRRLEAGCSAPVAAHATTDGEIVEMIGRVAVHDGSLMIEQRGRSDNARLLGERLADQALAQGADTILEAAK